MDKFSNYINSISNVTKIAMKDIEEISLKQTFCKKHILIPNLNHCQYLYFIEKGVARAFFYHNEKEITDWFGMENMVIGPIIRNFPIKDTVHRVELLEDSEIIRISFNDLENLYQKHHDIERLGRKIAIQTILHLQYRVDSLQLLSAKERYSDFLTRYPSLINRISLGHISSYLGMNQVTLSKIRKTH